MLGKAPDLDGTVGSGWVGEMVLRLKRRDLAQNDQPDMVGFGALMPCWGDPWHRLITTEPWMDHSRPR
jgi:hypothetical protein